jgi:superoxide dismutase, Cu-Zn family
MNHIKIILAFSASLAVIGCSPAQEEMKSGSQDQITRLAYGDLKLSDGTAAGAVKIVAEGGTVQLIVAPTNIPAGKSGFHLHQTGSCNAPDFASAGGHLNPLGKSHGTASPDGAHVGDLPNLTIGDGTEEPQKFALEGSVDQINAWLFDEDGTAVVIHAEPDDYKTDPSGAAGARIACAVLNQS